ncbi:hypothetical protein DAI22_06g215100 [Oryza sativa Japonica Group]|nr:hypothetical protein DAI22_06g215100 [Oryza sativa Japonica Group]
MVWPWNLPSRNNGPVHNSAQTWRRPPISWVKANTDWAFVMAHKFRAVEVVMRNDSGGFMAAVAQYHPKYSGRYHLGITSL